jgi:hypothetical protein
MGSDPQLDSERWLRQQSGVVSDLFERAATELQENGIRLLTGSALTAMQESDSSKKITLVPLRFAGSNGNESLSLSLLAAIRMGPAHYAVVLEVSGPLTYRALQTLAIEHADIWERMYLKVGLWIGEGTRVKLLNDLSQLTQSAESRLTIAGTFLHSDLGRTIQQGVMTMGLLYRSILDTLAGASKMGRLYVQLNHCLDNHVTTFQRIIRP